MSLNDEVSRLTAELAELRSQKPVARANENGPWCDLSLPEHYGSMDLYARPVPAAQAVPEAIRLDCARHLSGEYDCGRVDGWNQCREHMLAAAPQPPAACRVLCRHWSRSLNFTLMESRVLASWFNPRERQYENDSEQIVGPGAWESYRNALELLSARVCGAIDAAMQKGDAA